MTAGKRGGTAEAADHPRQHEFVRVRGAREHNLKNVDLDIPRLTLNVEELAVEQFPTEAAVMQAAEATKWWSGCNVHTCYC